MFLGAFDFLRNPFRFREGQSRHTKNVEEKCFARQLMIPETRHLTIFHPEKAVLKSKVNLFILPEKMRRKPWGMKS